MRRQFASDMGVEHTDPLTPRDRLLTTLHEAIWKLAHELLVDPIEPSLTDRLYILGELTSLDHRRDPSRAADQLERIIEAHRHNAAFSKYLGRLVGLLRKYDHDCRRYTAGVNDILEREEVARGSVAAGTSGDGLLGTTRVPAEVR